MSASSRSLGLVDELARRVLGARIHAHVERRVDRVREAALGTVELHRRDAEVEQDDVGAHAVRAQLLEHGGELAVRAAAPSTPCPRRNRSKYGATLGSRSIAISLPSPLQPRGEQCGVAAGAEGGVDHGLARTRVEGGDDLVGEDGDVIGLSWQDARQHLPRSLRPRAAVDAISCGPRSRGGRRHRPRSPRGRAPRARSASAAGRAVPAGRAHPARHRRRNAAAGGVRPRRADRGCAGGSTIPSHSTRG